MEFDISSKLETTLEYLAIYNDIYRKIHNRHYTLIEHMYSFARPMAYKECKQLPNSSLPVVSKIRWITAGC